jgi:hypothetical protein
MGVPRRWGAPHSLIRTTLAQLGNNAISFPALNDAMTTATPAMASDVR